MASVNRFRVKRGSQQWNDKGPDLIRTRANARVQLKALLGDRRHGLVNTGEGWVAKDSRAAIMDAFDGWRDGDTFRVGVRRDSEVDTVVVVKHEAVRLLPLEDCSPATVLAHSLIHAQFPAAIFSGGYVWKETSSGVWSDHAWGTAIDESHNPDKGLSNEKVTDWCARMGRTGNMKFDYLLGSKDSLVVQVGPPDFDFEPSSASSSHKWHNHISVVDHDGRKPPRTGGVF